MRSGSGYFREYLQSDFPFYLKNEEEDFANDSEHIFFSCSCWVNLRSELEIEADADMTESEENWTAIFEFCEKSLTIKKSDLGNHLTPRNE